eukprot:CAMPEP_0194109680 /NCGR_PEP_ID=MMETSP0150-20130528/9111_1 /TAXON_ID=122233 /ORGANISM="Chaetoceros debilis, Strain MM31A-1" /LENGTH=354 /DNA_ID=CAMNT_0038798687 /DNA_START=58 /DNA_END=1122 /DNA_ORIENTATION=-
MEYNSVDINTNTLVDKTNSNSMPNPKLVDPDYWNPKASNFEIVDWDRWESSQPRIPSVFEPPQRYNYSDWKFWSMWWWNRSCLFQPIAFGLHGCCGGFSGKSSVERISNGDKLFKSMLRPNPNSDVVPEPFRNKLFWTENNIADETLVSFNRWAWRKNTDEGRTIALGAMQHDWSNNNTCFGYASAYFQKTRFASIQGSPDGKWFLAATISDPKDPETLVNYLWFYVVQEDDEFKTPDGKAMDYVKPGDLVRISYGDGRNPYENDNSKITYWYFPRAVAELDSNGELKINHEHADDLISKATNQSGKACETCCYSCAICMTPEERFEFQVNNISDRQVFEQSPTPPSADMIDRF